MVIITIIWLIFLSMGKSTVEGVNFLSSDAHADFSDFPEPDFFPPERLILL